MQTPEEEQNWLVAHVGQVLGTGSDVRLGTKRAQVYMAQAPTVSPITAGQWQGREVG